MTKVDEAFTDLKAGSDHNILKKRYSSGTLSRAYTRYLEWAKTRRQEISDSISRLEKKEKGLQDITKRLEKDKKKHERIFSNLKKQISNFEKKEQEILDHVSELKKSRDSLETALKDLNTRGVTEETITRFNSIDFRDDDELLKRIETLEAFTQLEKAVSKLHAESKNYKLLVHEQEDQYEQVMEKVRSKENELDEAKRKYFYFEESIEIVKSCLQAGYDKKTLLSLKEALTTLEITGKQDVSVKRLLVGLRDYKELYALQSTLRTKRQELTEVEKELEQGRGTLSAFRENVLKELKTTEKQFTKSIKSISKEYLKGIEDLGEFFIIETNNIFKHEQEMLDEFKLEAIKILASIGYSYSTQLFEIIEQAKKLNQNPKTKKTT